jgi:AraC-like DNA-binding protein/mannose-6-phosphate isomerase-like protein (cupin superfamily)
MLMRMMPKAIYKKVLPDPHRSWCFACHQMDSIPLQPHYHSAYEISLTLGGHGHRYIGDSVEEFDDGDLVLIGPNVIHAWYSPALHNGQTHTVYVAQLPAAWLENVIETMPELASMRGLLQTSARGIQFSKATARIVASLFADMQQADAFDQFANLVQILKKMKADVAARPLSSQVAQVPEQRDYSAQRLDRVLHYIHEHYTEDLNAEKIARYAHMSTNHFHRFIKQRTDKTFNALLTELRINKACSLLLSSALQIATIGSQCGFNDLSNFNRRFMQLRGCTPSEYRRVGGQAPISLSTTPVPWPLPETTRISVAV